ARHADVVDRRIDLDAPEIGRPFGLGRRGVRLDLPLELLQLLIQLLPLWTRTRLEARDLGLQRRQLLVPTIGVLEIRERTRVGLHGARAARIRSRIRAAETHVAARARRPWHEVEAG